MTQRDLSAPRRCRSACAALLASVLLAIALVRPVSAQTASDGEVKMVLIYKFSKFIEWPPAALAAASRQFTLCTLGPIEPYQAGIAAIEGRPVQGRELHVHKLATAADLSGCQILFIADVEPRRLPALLATAHGLNILTVSDLDQFTDAGGTVGLSTPGNRVKFSFNLHAARAANLRISPELLSLAASVTGGERN